MEKLVLIVAFVVCFMITPGIGVKCYLQQCEQRGTDDGWNCFTKNDGIEKECSDGCAESNQGKILARTCSNELPHDGPTKTEEKGKICSEQSLMTRDNKQVTTTNCHCKTPMCNNFTKLEKVEVLKQ